MEEKRHFGREIRILSNMMRRKVDSSETLKKTRNITGTGGWLLGYLYSNRDRDIYQRDVENEFMIRRATCSKVITLMEGKGLVRRESVRIDARLKKLTLTDEGLELQKNICAELGGFDEKFLRGISEEEISSLYRTLDKIKENIGE